MRLNIEKILNLRKILSDPKKFFSFLILIFILIFIESFIAQTKSFDAKVIKVIDGDTIEVLNLKGDKNKIRLFGIDAPELKQKFGIEAKNYLRSIIQDKKVKIIYKDKDIYDRILAIVEFDNLDINQIMVSKGFAWSYSFYSDIYTKDQKFAQKNHLGLWEDKNPIEPYKWRKQNKF
ncbi:thermonuclease family protein [Campylobacter sp. 2018MI35]|uniref:thermonuclease family protein n=1 Tax=unclassified Campylobacter TaxID=2593542 RepID=UPI001904D5CE|nr:MULTISPECIES: thermonuclease family protein [unclassified Campylobacter]MBK1971127.1 thermonuclease family protein [Campylobacter sp. TTU_617]MBK1991614.1 thermonuclease family protein [Campylobacter sp. 2018MI34]